MRVDIYPYEVRDLFPWEIITKIVISCLLKVDKIWNSAQIILSSTLNFLPKILFRRNNIHREIDHWNRRWFGAKWHVTVPNSVAPVKSILCKWIYMLQGNVVKWNTHDTYVKFSSVFSWNCDFEHFFLKFMTKNAGFFCHLVLQELNVIYEISIFRLMFMWHKKQLSWRNGIRY